MLLRLALRLDRTSLGAFCVIRAFNKTLKFMRTIINIVLILVISASLVLIDRDLKKQQQTILDQQNTIDSLSKQIGYHDIRITSQLNTLMVHRSRLEQIKDFLKTIGSSFVKK